MEHSGNHSQEIPIPLVEERRGPPDIDWEHDDWILVHLVDGAVNDVHRSSEAISWHEVSDHLMGAWRFVRAIEQRIITGLYDRVAFDAQERTERERKKRRFLLLPK